jgi:hypothetical protein
MSIALGLTVAGMVAVGALSSFAEDSRPVRYTALVLEGTTQGGTGFKLEIRTRAFAGSDSKAKWYWGTDGLEPRRLLEDLNLVVGTVRVKVPEAAVADLANPSLQGGVFLVEESDRIVVHINGGDGAGSYEAVLETCDGSISARRISHFNSDGDFVTDREDFSTCAHKNGVSD